MIDAFATTSQSPSIDDLAMCNQNFPHPSKEDGLKVQELGNRMSLDSGTLTPLLKKLESQNLIKRKRGEGNERTVTINLAYPGKSLQSKVMESIKTMEKDFASTLGKQTGELLSAAEEFLEKLKSIGSGGPNQTV